MKKMTLFEEKGLKELTVSLPEDMHIELVLKLRAPYRRICAGVHFGSDRLVIATTVNGDLEYLEFTAKDYATPLEAMNAALEQLHLRRGTVEDYVEIPLLGDDPISTEGTIVYTGTTKYMTNLPDTDAYKFYSNYRDVAVYFDEIESITDNKYFYGTWTRR